MLEVSSLSCGYGSKTIVHDADLTIEPGQTLCLLGPNGSGKTTLFKTILGFLKPMGGKIFSSGRDMLKMNRRELAREIAYVPQSHTTAFPFRVFDMVTMGRTAHMGTFASPSRHDRIKASGALESLGVSHLAAKPYTEISGGERQMVLIARAIAQEAKMVIMDEPSSNLDFGNQVKVLTQIRKLSSLGVGVLLTTHFPEHALLCADHVAIMHDGQVRVAGSPHETITEKCLKEIYGVEARVLDWIGENGVQTRACVPVLIKS